jgi:N-acetylated-alpha-linked acidic dipeptidase
MFFPFDFNSFYKTLNDYATEVKGLLDNERNDTEVENKMVKDNVYNLAKDPTKTYLPPATKDPVPYLDFSDLENNLVHLKTLAEDYQKLYNGGTLLPVEKQNQLNQVLFNAERSLVSENGLPRRPWYKHEIYAPGFYTGYGVKTLPAIREAIEQKNWKEAQEGISTVSRTIQAYNNQVQQAVNLLNRPAF